MKIAKPIITLCLLATACSQPPLKPVTSSHNSGASGSDDSSLNLSCSETKKVGQNPVKRLTRVQYLNAVRDLFGEIKAADKVLPNQIQSFDFGQTPDNSSLTDVESYQSAAEAIALEIATTPASLNAAFPCESAKDKAACALSQFTKLATRAFRGEPSAADLKTYAKLYQLGAKSSHEHGVEVLISGLLQSPKFLYLSEFGSGKAAANGLTKLSGNEVAARLSFAIWNSIPDEDLMEAAASGSLKDTEGVRKELKRMLASPKGSDLYLRFLSDWIGLDKLLAKSKSESLYPDWKSEENRVAIRDQAQAFFKSVIESDKPTVTALLTSTNLPQNEATSKIFGVTGGKGQTFADVTGPKGYTSGILSLPAFNAILASPEEGNPIMRGRFIRERVLCQALPSAPGAIPEPIPFDPSVPTRQRHMAILDKPACGACHKSMDLIGFGMENFDAIGKLRMEDAGMPVDNSGEIVSWPSDGKFQGVVELGEMLAGSDEAQDCMAKLWFRFLLARFNEDADSCYLDSVAKDFGDDGGSLMSLPSLILGNELFLYTSKK